jgi:signal transduction histidine kinase
MDARIADEGLDGVIDGLAHIAAMSTGCPIVMVHRVDIDRQWVMTRNESPWISTPHLLPFCGQATRGSDLFEVPDAALDPRFSTNPLVIGAPGLRFYAAVPLQVGGRTIGSLCVIDHAPRCLDAAQRALFVELAHAVEHWFTSRRDCDRLLAAKETLSKSLGVIPGALFQYVEGPGERKSFAYAGEGLRALCDLAPGQLRHDARAFFARIHPDDRMAVRAAIDRSSRRLAPWRQQFRLESQSRGLRRVECHAMPEQMSDGSVRWHGHLQPLTTAPGQEQAPREQNLADRSPDPAGLVRQAALQALVQIDELLLPSRLEQVLRPVRVVLADVLASSLELIEPLAEQLEIEIEPASYDAAFIAHANEGALQHVLLSLLSDCVKTSGDPHRLSIELGRAQGEVAVCISSLHVEESRISDFGLSQLIGRQLIEAMRGRLEIRERPDGGRRFEVWLPTPEAAAQ